MELVLWRHADAEQGADDLARRLTQQGFEQARRMGAWLDAHLPKAARVVVSPAVRARQTAACLQRDRTTDPALAPGAEPAAILAACGWPRGDATIVAVGHQPTLGGAVALALTGKAVGWSMPNGAIWWIASREGESVPRVVAVLNPEFL
jgi:phosphohistidine phosphatase